MLEIKEISKSFGQNKILKGVSFSVPSNKIYGLIGKNGAGKTTLMNIIAGLSQASEGEFFINGKDSSDLTAGKIGYLPDIPSFFDYLSAKEYIDFLLMNINNRENTKRRNYLLETVGLKGNEKIKSISRGMKQRLGIAASLVNDPDILLLDEPTSALDPAGRHEFVEILKLLRNEGKSIVLSTHILTDMELVCDKVGFLHDGIIKKEIDIKQLSYGNKDIWEITFEPIDKLPEYDISQLTVIRQNHYTYSFKTKNQKYLLDYLKNIPSNITSIKNKYCSLDELFEEVCK